jgi:hypothetical protein
VIEQRLTCQPDSPGDSFRRYRSSPLDHDGFPGHARRDLFEHVGDQNPGTSKSGLAVADLRVSNDESSDHPGGLGFSHAAFLDSFSV